ncbi:FACT complex subunit [Umbelopsis nana]
MSDRKNLDFDSIHSGLDSVVGRFRLAPNGIGWKGSDETTKIIAATDIRKFTWLRVARGHELRITQKDGTTSKFDGFKKEEYDEISHAIKSMYKQQIEAKELSLRGWNWGKTEFQGPNLVFNVGNKEMFELPLSQAIGANKPGKNEVAINFVDPGQRAPDGINPKTTDELMDITFYVPGTVPKEENADGNTDEDDGEELNADAVFYENVKSKLELGQLTSENIVQFQEVLCLTPRGRYNIDMFQDFLRLRGKSYDYKIMYSSIIKLFLLLKPDEVHVMFVIGLDPPLRQGQTKYPFLVFQFVRDEEIDVDLNIDEETLKEKYDGKLQKTYDAPTYEIVSTVFRALTGRKVTVPSNFRSHHGSLGIKSSMKANEGYLYPLEKCFLFIPKPPTFIPHSEIGVVTFSRVSASTGGSSRTFDMKFSMKTGHDYQFSSINREEYANLEEFIKSKKIKMKNELNEETTVSYAELGNDSDEDMGGSRKRRRKEEVASYRDDEDEDEESPDEDFAPGSDSEVAEEFDSNASASDDGDDASDED